MNTELLFERVLDDVHQQGYAIIEQALCPDLTAQLYATAQAQLSAFSPAAIGRQDEQQLNSEVRKDKTLWFSGSCAAERDYLAVMEALRLTVNRHFYLGLFDYECHFAYYQAGDFYKKHYDAFKGRSNRVLTTVFYLNTPAQGGELVIYKPRSKEIAERVAPKAGTLVVFESERFMHEVLPAQQPRFSIAGWFRKNNSIAGVIDPPR
ncbi:MULTISPECIES: 2OG-Fe(II) oxygenase [unclassified Pseudoalteromonas]|uniref:2OG-Fe(II) oxygenase n=1 Tax=unclassified Pseudoalteromonas TaxID=194690 RepID=UPI000CF72E03|nr:2OG-Fe(II) oxygenase [Pseudoalteromonas sp. T1lg76]